MWVQLLGAVAAGDDPASVREPPGLVPASVLAHLALARGHVLTAESLADRVWDVPPDGARNALQAAVSRLRRQYGDALVTTTSAGYRLPLEQVAVDALECEADEAAARASRAVLDHGTVLDRTGAALARFRGDPLAGLASSSSALARTALTDLRRRLVLLRAESLLAVDRAADALPPLRTEAEAHPLDEPLQAMLLRALAADGRASEALSSYDRLRRRLADELGTDPSPAVADTFAAILAGTVPGRRELTPAPSASVSAPRDVAIVLSDVVRSGQLWRRHPDVMPQVMLLHHQVVADVVREHDGVLPPDQGEGDSRLAVFASAARALEAAGDFQRRLAAATWPGGVRPRVRVAVTTGSIVEAGGNVFGATIHRCARLRALAWGDQVLVARDAAELTEGSLDRRWRLSPVGRVSLRDFGDEMVFQLDDESRPVAFPALRTTIRLPGETASYVGRLTDITDTAAAVVTHRLVTLTGIGGSGKTRLAVRVARAVAGDFPGGVAFIDLSAAVTAAAALDLVAAEVAPGLPPLEALATLDGAPCLVVLDNLEQLDDAGSVLRAVLGADSVSALVTSRRPVGLPDELVRPLGPLTDADAVELLEHRVQECAPGVSLDPQQAAELVHLLGGLPLALELAASRLRVMGVDELTSAVASRFTVLRGGPDRPERQQALPALISDSWDGLPPAGRRVLTAVGLFRRGASTAVLADTTSVDLVTCLDLVDDLVGRGLVRTSPRDGSAPRFTVLELVRRFVLENVDPEELRALRAAHARAMTRLVMRGGSRLLLDLREDVGAAVRSVLEDDVEDAALRLQLARHALAFGWWEEAVALLEPAADQPGARNPLGVALLRRDRPGDVERARALLEDAARGGDADAASALAGSVKGRDPALAYRWYVEALRLQPGDPYALGNVLEHEIVSDGAGALVARHDAVEAAHHRRREQVDAGVDLPWSAYDLAKLLLWLGDEDTALHALLDAVSSTTHVRQAQTTLASYERLAEHLGASGWSIAVEVLRVAVRLHADPLPAKSGFAAPVLVLAGASAADAHDVVVGWADELTEAFAGLGGTVVSGGTDSGVSALAVQVARSTGARSVGYLPLRLPRRVRAEGAYDELRRTDGTGFSLREPLAYWTDLLAAGVRPRDVRVLGIGGGRLTSLELHLAAATGADVAVAGPGVAEGQTGARWHRPPRLLARDAAGLRRWRRP